MDKAPKQKTSVRRRGRATYVVVEGKRVKSTPRVARILRLARKALKGFDVPPP